MTTSGRMNILKKFAPMGAGLALGLMIDATIAPAQDARFFRVAGPVPVTITAFTQDGTVTWMNTLTNTTFTVQTAADLAASNWVDWVQVPASNATTIHRICDPNPPAGLVFIPAGSFTMGDAFSEGDTRERPLHTVYVSAIYMDKYEVTKSLWAEVHQWATNHGYSFANVGSGKAADHPVQTISWYDSVKWCNARSEKEGRTPAYYTDAAQATVYRDGDLSLTNECVKWEANGYRLPTEAEWEKAARGGLSGQRFPWGNTISHSQANYYSIWDDEVPRYPYDLSFTSGTHPSYTIDGWPFTSPVGDFAPNGYGLYDMAGNIEEWCWDMLSIDYYSSSPSVDPRGPNIVGGLRVERGGAWASVAGGVKCAIRSYLHSPSNARDGVGFRCVRGL